ncbi:hypothetical protein [Desnuesiella massiliensis]|uniref:hypothetical protein n=1 Tax=Desnuesiella massiliensis TaxID=1650662 RepID=UPI0006E3F6ED|nr:hypothetical protein [Desnuesiella massiliensis]
MNDKRPFIITFIGDMGILSAILSIISLFSNFIKSFEAHHGSLSVFLNGMMRAVIPVILLIISYGYLKLKSWGYWLMITSNIAFLVIPIVSSQLSKQQFPYVGIIMVTINLIFILPTKKYFDKEAFSQ